ncbi:hypothetical protein F0562_012908 [Nyssa sinensis]|uniref:Uncharacterized protein n=1 Tax=Nyssa sinensis TaxID=561372 RepID=A0A5J4ZTZ7_9ASTE|nr:hypothetical protein F0562_012908 [Nyssa sinensis]
MILKPSPVDLSMIHGVEMRGMQYSLQGKGALEVSGFGSVSSSEAKWKQEGSCASNEPISVLDTRRSPSPSTSTSTLSSSFGGCGSGGGTAGSGGSVSTDNTASVAAVSDSNPQQKWPVSLPLETGSAATTEPGFSTGFDGGRKDEWVTELQPIPAGLELSGPDRFGLGLEDWESLLSESGPDQSLLRWIADDVDDTSFGLKHLLHGADPNRIDDNAALGIADQGSGFIPVSTGGSTGNAIPSVTPNLSCGVGSGLSSNDNNSGKIGSTTINSSSGIVNCKGPNHGLNNSNPQNSISTSLMINLPHVVSLPPGGIFQQQFETPDEKPQLFNPQVPMNEQLSQVPQNLQSQNFFPPSLYAKEDHPHHLLQSQPKCQILGLDYRSQIPKVPLFDPANELLHRKQQQHVQLLPHHLMQKPLMVPKQEAAGSVGEEMAARQIQNPQQQFMNFTSNQALLEALDDAERIHIIDFDVGFGAQWASFMQELPTRNKGTPSLKITAFASPSTHHPFELCLMHENLTQFANEIGINFELEVVNFDSFDPNSYSMPLFQTSENEVIAVNFPIWCCLSHLSALPSLLRFIKQLSPKIVVSLDRGCERIDLPFSHHLLHALQYYEVLLDSIEATNVTSDTTNKIERFIFLPMIENIVLGRLSAPEKMAPWKALFASAGFSPVAFSNFAETQAECLVKRTPGRGFRVEKRQASLVLWWQSRELMSASAWRC